MAYKILHATTSPAQNGGTDYTMEVWLDDTKSVPDPVDPLATVPDPGYVRVLGGWNKPRRMQLTDRQYLNDPTVRKSMRDAAATALAEVHRSSTEIASLAGSTL